MATPANTKVIHAYRHLLRGFLRAVQYSRPARFTIRDRMREEFRDPNGALDADSVKRTVWFLEAAAREAGLEHRILKNLLTVTWTRRDATKMWKRAEVVQRTWTARQDAYRHYDLTVAMLNKTMGLCLK